MRNWMRDFSQSISCLFVLAAVGLSAVGILVVLIVVGPRTSQIFGTAYGTFYFTAVAKAWSDDNRNGQWDQGEAPLPGVQFVVATSGGAVRNRLSGDQGGTAMLTAVENCVDSDCESSVISAVAPEGYCPTTPTQRNVPSQNENGNPVYLFGFTRCTLVLPPVFSSRSSKEEACATQMLTQHIGSLRRKR